MMYLLADMTELSVADGELHNGIAAVASVEELYKISLRQELGTIVDANQHL